MRIKSKEYMSRCAVRVFFDSWLDILDYFTSESEAKKLIAEHKKDHYCLFLKPYNKKEKILENSKYSLPYWVIERDKARKMLDHAKECETIEKARQYKKNSSKGFNTSIWLSVKEYVPENWK